MEHALSYANPDLYVFLSKGRYQLVTSNAIYSWADLYANFVKAFQRLRWELLPGDDLLSLGLGLGSIPYMLETKFNKSFHYTAVEVDEQVIYLAQKYVLDELKIPIQVIHADAVAFIRQTSQKWDMICVDLFIDDEIPGGALSVDFIRDMKARLSEDGLILFNSLARTQDDMKESRRFLDEIFLPVFPAGGYLDVGGNWILVSDKRFFAADSVLSAKTQTTL